LDGQSAYFGFDPWFESQLLATHLSSCIFPLLGAWRLGTVSWAIVSREDWLALPNETLFVPKEWNERGDDGDDG
jgi:hypothetical protein